MKTMDGLNGGKLTRGPMPGRRRENELTVEVMAEWRSMYIEYWGVPPEEDPLFDKDEGLGYLPCGHLITATKEVYAGKCKTCSNKGVSLEDIAPFPEWLDAAPLREWLKGRDLRDLKEMDKKVYYAAEAVRAGKRRRVRWWTADEILIGINGTNLRHVYTDL